MRDNDDEFILKAPQDNIRHPIVDYSKSWKGTCEAREIDPYATDKLLGIDYRFWNIFHSNFYAIAVLTKPRGNISKMQFINFSELEERSEFAAAIKTCDCFQLIDIMSFKCDWNREILDQFHATYFWNRDADEIYWMTDGRHYRIDFVTFCRILGFGHVHRTYSRIHDVRRLEPHEVSFVWDDPSRADGRRTGLKGFYYTMNNLFRITLNPKDSATDLNGYITNV
jgi:hypothetical protein